MPPQPIRKHLSEAGRRIVFGPSALYERPKLAVRIAAIASIWAQTDAHLGLVLVAMLKADAQAATAVYLALISGGVRNEALLVAAEFSLLEDVSAELRKILGKLRKSAKERNAIIHGLWGKSSDYPDELILQDSTDDIATRANLMAMARRGIILTDEQNEKAKRGRLMVYSEHDFVEIERRSISAQNMVHTFFTKVYDSSPLPHPRFL